MSKALSKTEQFLKYGPYILWFGMHIAISIVLTYQRSFADTIYYLVTYVFFGSLIIWVFGYRLFPEYLEKEGSINRRLGFLIGANIILFIAGIYAHTFMAKVLGLSQISDQYAPKSVRIALWVLMVVLGILFLDLLI